MKEGASSFNLQNSLFMIEVTKTRDVYRLAQGHSRKSWGQDMSPGGRLWVQAS